jgi:type I restriction enzyme S subunit
MVDEVCARSVGVSYPAINALEIGCLPVPLLPADRQRAIAAFLDRKTAAIDALVSKKERLIDLLHEKRQALITRAVTKGVDPNVRMKNSGVEWLGKIPAHWTLVPLRRRLLHIEQGWSPACESRPADEGEWGVLKVGCVNYGVFDYRENKALPSDLSPLPELEVRQGDVLISRANTRALAGSAALVGEVPLRLLLCDKLFRLRYRVDEVHAPYLLLALQSRPTRHQFERDATGASGSMQNLGQDSILNLLLPWPPLQEQRALATGLDGVFGDVSRVSTAVREQIARLREYRQTLIAAAVTGKIDVNS